MKMIDFFEQRSSVKFCVTWKDFDDPFHVEAMYFKAMSKFSDNVFLVNARASLVYTITNEVFIFNAYPRCLHAAKSEIPKMFSAISGAHHAMS